MRYKVEYEWEMAGWDEFNYSLLDSDTVEAESVEEAEEKVKRLNKGKRVYINKVINII